MKRLHRMLLPAILMCALIFSSAATALAAKSAENAHQNGGLIVEDDKYLYYAGEGGGPLYRQKKSDPKSIKMLADGDVTSLAKQGEWLYFFEMTRKQINSGIYKMKTDGTGKMRLSDRWVSGISVQGDALYYLSEVGGVFKLSADGKKNQPVYEPANWQNSRAGDLYIADGWIYFSVLNGKKTSGSIYKVKLGSTKVQMLSNQIANKLYVK
ncbi:MAG: DUF5050 domain-containing protein, partial [Cohnella sp.]|nr:DUF5050 domain-containing protein [Cohnella sp.]